MKRSFFVHLHFFELKIRFLSLEEIIKIIIFTLLFIALASPILVDRLNPLNRFGKDIVLAIDASGSMNASDFSKEDSEDTRISRFEITKIIAKDFIQKRQNDNLGIVLYGDFAFIASPITYEKEMIVDMLRYLTQGMAGQNTAIGEAIAMSVRAFKHSKAKEKIIILLSDGEHNSGAISPKNAIELAKEKDIKIYTIAMSKDKNLDISLLSKISNSSKGEFFYANSTKELREIYEKINSLESSSISSKEYVLKEYFYQYFVLFAILLLILLIFRERNS